MPTLPIELQNLGKNYSYLHGKIGTYDRYLADQKSSNLQAFANYLTGGGSTGFYLTVNDEALLKQINALAGVGVIYNRVIEAARREFIPQCIPILTEILIEAADAQHEGAFPDRFKEPLFRATKYIPPPTVTGNAPQLAVVTLPNIYDYLGGEDEYSAAFHHGALLANRLEGRQRANIRLKRYSESVLQVKSASQRYRYWKAIQERKTSLTFKVAPEVGPFRSKTGQFTDREHSIRSATIEVPIEGTWDDTVQARLDAWRRVKPDGAPQWLLLEYGQPKWQPAIKVATEYGFVAKIKAGGGAKRIAVSRGSVLGYATGTLSSTTEVRRAATSITQSVVPGNISGAWVNALESEWNRILITVMASQIDQFNKTSTAAKFDVKTSRLRSPITGKFLPKPTNFQSFLPTRSSRVVEPYGAEAGPSIPFRNAPIPDEEYWESLGGITDILDDDF